MYLRLPVYPTSEKTAEGARIWESAVEAEPMLVCMLMLGGTNGKGLYDAYNDLMPEPPPPDAFDPARWNLNWTWVMNDDNTLTDAGWQPIRITDRR
jgi:hypothetical protein